MSETTEQKLLAEILELSRRYGVSGHWVLRGGGNTSIKDDTNLWVKASGSSLATIRPDQFVRMSRERLDAIWEKRYPLESDAREKEAKDDLFGARSPGEEEKRPSVEALMHALFPQRIVYHTHPTLINAISCSLEGEAAARRIFSDDLLWIPVIDPGYVLARTIYDAVDAYRRSHSGAYPPVVILQNHGLVVWGENGDDIAAMHARVIDSVSAALSQTLRESYERWDSSAETPAEGLRRPVESATSPAGLDAIAHDAVALLAHHGDPAPVATVDDGEIVATVTANYDAFRPMEPSLTPDHIVYAGHKPLWFDPDTTSLANAIGDYRESEGCDPKVIACAGTGIVAVAGSENSSEAAALLFRDAAKIAILSADFGGVQGMPDARVDFIRNWEVEAFRRQVSTS